MILETPITLEYTYSPGQAASRFVRGILDGKLLGQRCPRCGKVYIPPRGACSMCGVATTEEVPLANTGTVTTFCVVNVPSKHLPIPVPYVCAHILLDGADTPGMFLMADVKPDEVRLGMRVEAVWADERKPTLESIRYFRPTGEPDAPYEAIKEYT